MDSNFSKYYLEHPIFLMPFKLVLTKYAAIRDLLLEAGNHAINLSFVVGY